MINIEEKDGKNMNIAKGDLAWHNIFIIEHKINKITTLICNYKRMRDIVFWKLNTYYKVKRSNKEYDVNKTMWMKTIWAQLLF